MAKYRLEFVLHIQDASPKTVKSSLSEFAEDIEITDDLDPNNKGRNFRVHLDTGDPTTIFDICAQFGRIKTVKINEVK